MLTLYYVQTKVTGAKQIMDMTLSFRLALLPRGFSLSARSSRQYMV